MRQVLIQNKWVTLLTEGHTMIRRNHVQRLVYGTDINIIRLQIFRVHVFGTELQTSLPNGIAKWAKNAPIFIY